jgi:hypothetical protein
MVLSLGGAYIPSMSNLTSCQSEDSLEQLVSQLLGTWIPRAIQIDCSREGRQQTSKLLKAAIRRPRPPNKEVNLLGLVLNPVSSAFPYFS